jgi:hypothetical protein
MYLDNHARYVTQRVFPKARVLKLCEFQRLMQPIRVQAPNPVPPPFRLDIHTSCEAEFDWIYSTILQIGLKWEKEGPEK